ncbi:MAG: hypothetical protein COA84_14925 [Robiginitomaculum sp.]|nr:MAG: hypothetical protein COA84_14925 [Robiginitomaculum sp.]
MSYFQTKRAMTTHLLNNLPTGLTSDDVAFENYKFNPANKSLWLAAYFIPASTESMGKTVGSGDEQRGIFQVSVFVALNSNKFDEVQLQAIDELISAFKYNTQMVYTTQTVQSLESTVNTGSESEAWYQRDISINYLTFSTR